MYFMFIYEESKISWLFGHDLFVHLLVLVMSSMPAVFAILSARVIVPCAQCKCLISNTSFFIPFF